MEKMEEDILARDLDPADFPILNSKPEIFRDVIWIWEGFMCLSQSRQVGMAGPLPIAISEILAYCMFKGIDDLDDRDELLYHTQELDKEFMRDYAKKRPKTDQKTPPKGLGQQ